MTKRQQQLAEAKEALLTGYGALKPGSLVIAIGKRSRTGKTSDLSFYSIAHSRDGLENLAVITFHVAAVLGYKTKAGSPDTMRTDTAASELLAYLSSFLFGDGTHTDKKHNELRLHNITL